MNVKITTPSAPHQGEGEPEEGKEGGGVEEGERKTEPDLALNPVFQKS